MSDGIMSERRLSDGAGPSRSPAPPTARADAPEGGLLGPDGHVRTMADLETAAIRAAMRLYGGNLSEVARRLGIGRSTLYRKLPALRGRS